MQAMNVKEYLGITLDMEKSIFLQEKVAAHLEDELRKLHQPQKFFNPVVPQRPQKRDIRVLKSAWDVILLISVCFATWFLAAAVIMIGVAVFKISDTFLILSLIPPIYYAGEYFYQIVKTQNKFDEEVSRYREQLEAYNREIKRNQINSAKDKEHRAAKIAFLQSTLSQVNRRLDMSKGYLETIYNKNILFPKYRNLIAVSSLYEYICSGRCSTLEGYEGGYNTYEKEIRLDAIITKMDEVITSLEEIRKNQFILYSAVQDINKQSSLILESTHSVERQLQGLGGQAGSIAEKISELQKTSALTAYYAERTQKELSYMNRMDYLSGRNDRVLHNLPPS